MTRKTVRLTYTQTIVLSFFLLILAGAILLCFPFSSRMHEWTPFINSLFTATSASCVTGLVVLDTHSHWSFFGQLIIICLIQIGGLGVMTFIAMFSLFFKRKFSLGQRRLLMQAAGSLEISGMAKLLRRIIHGTAIIEGIGAGLLCFVFIPRFGFLRGLWYAIFHSISAFCNAGFDLLGRPGSQFVSFSEPEFRFDPILNFTIMGLIVVGGIGFIVWRDIARHGIHFQRYELHSKIALTTTAILLVGATVLFVIFEHNHAFAGFTTGQAIMAAMFQAVTPRTAGFNTCDLSKLSESGRLLTTMLMFIGGSPGSTAGGIKTTTFAVLILTTIASARREQNVTVFRRRFDNDILIQASAIFTIYGVMLLTGVLIISAIEPFSLTEIMFEATSAIGTVGLTLGITPKLCFVSKCILIFLMFAGRVGGLSFMLVLAERRKTVPISRPKAQILIG